MIRVISLASLVLLCAAARADDVDDVVATVNGVALTGDDLRISLALRGLPEQVSPTVRRQAVEWLIERELIRQFLQRNKSTVDPEPLEAAVRRTVERLQREKRPAEPSLESLGIDEARVAAEMAVPVAWRRHAARATTDQQIRAHFEKHRRHFDGTRLRVSQIFRKYDQGESIEDAPATTAALNAIRTSITRGTTTFAEAARSSSQSPSAKNAGDVGWIDPQGDLPAAVSNAAFALKAGDVSDVILSPFGAHLVTVTDVKPGDLSLEDVRPEVQAELADALWTETVAAERQDAKIVVNE